MIDENDDWLSGEECDNMSTSNVNDYINCRSGIGCGETHLHCVDCDEIVELGDRKACTMAPCATSPVRDARCRECAWRHYKQEHRYRDENVPTWERVP